MFEKIVLRRCTSGEAMTLGEIAEAMLFYQNVHLIIDHGLLSGIVDLIGIEGLLDLLDRNVTATYSPDMLGTSTTKIGAIDHHKFIGFQFSGDQEAGQLRGNHKVIERILVRKGYDKKKAGLLTERFLKRVSVKAIASDKFFPGGICNAATLDLYENAFLVEAVNETLFRTEGATRINGLTMEVIPTHAGFHVLSNIDFFAINTVRSQMAPPREPLTLAHFLQSVFEARADMMLASHYGGDFRTSDTSSGVIAVRSRELLHRAGLNLDQISLFQNVVIAEGRTVKEAINSGDKQFSDFLKLIDRSDRFKGWISKIHPDQAIVTAYISEMSRVDWIQSLPAKILRYSMSTVADFIEPLLGTTLSAADTFLLEKLLKGWRPHHFVEKQLKPFVAENR